MHLVTLRIHSLSLLWIVFVFPTTIQSDDQYSECVVNAYEMVTLFENCTLLNTFSNRIFAFATILNGICNSENSNHYVSYVVCKCFLCLFVFGICDPPMSCPTYVKCYMHLWKDRDLFSTICLIQFKSAMY